MSEPQVFERIRDEIGKNDVLLFMKGTPVFPQCGFSAAVVDVLSQLGVKFHGVNILVDPELRQGIKEFSQWPTIPQLYVSSSAAATSSARCSKPANSNRSSRKRAWRWRKPPDAVPGRAPCFATRSASPRRQARIDETAGSYPAVFLWGPVAEIGRRAPAVPSPDRAVAMSSLVDARRSAGVINP